jgi:hypothetical protein
MISSDSKSVMEKELDQMLSGEDGNALGSITDTFEDILSGFFGKSLKDAKLSLTDSIKDIMLKVGTDLIFNKNSILNSMQQSDRIALKKLLKLSRLTKQEALSILKKNNYIVKACQ